MALNKQKKKRYSIIFIILSVVILLMCARVFWIEIVSGDFYTRKLSVAVSKSKVETPMRGLIYDRNGKVLAENIPVSTVYADSKLMNDSKQNIEEISKTLSDILGCDKDSVGKKLESLRQYVIIQKKVDSDKSQKIKDWIKDNKIKGLFLQDDTKRYYPNNNLAAQVIGFTGIDNQGLNGIELQFEEYLKCIPGKKTFEKDARGNSLPFGDEKNIYKQDGLNVVLTIDQNIQYYMEKALKGTIEKYKVLNGSNAIAIDPRNGQILAMASMPDYNLNNPTAMPNGVTGLDTGTWKSLSDSDKIKKRNETVWKNNAINITYEPGSTFKSITAAMGFEEGLVNTNTQVYDDPVTVSGWKIEC
jgi:stage V sporulation protein D (sporulation-specific penicillin-binding protein)